MNVAGPRVRSRSAYSWRARSSPTRSRWSATPPTCIHPIAGQGLNLGLRDVAALAEAIVDAARLGLDIGGADVLERYQRWRRFDTMTMGIATDGINRLFSNHSDALRLAPRHRPRLVDRLPPLKDVFIREAAGVTGEVPRLLRGEAL